MRVLHVIHRFLPEGVVGGTTTYLRDLATAQQRDHDVLIFCGGPRRSDSPLAEQLEVDGLSIVKIHNNDQHWQWQSSSTEVNEAFKEVLMSFDPDIVHFHSIVLLSLDLPRLAREHGVRTVYTLHDQYFVCVRGFPAQPTSGGYQACYARGGLKCYRCTKDKLKPATDLSILLHTAIMRPRAMSKTFSQIDRFIAPSKWIAGYYLANGFSDDRMTICGYGLNTEPFAHSVKSEADSIRFAYLGGGHPAKGLDLLLEAFQHVESSAELHVFGQYDDARVAKHRRDRVHFDGTLYPKDKPRAFQDIDVIVVPSLFPDNSPLVIHEARASGTPVIGSNIGGIPELIDEGKTGYLAEPGDVQSLSQLLGRFCSHKQMARDMGRSIQPIKPIEQHLDEISNVYEEAGS